MDSFNHCKCVLRAELLACNISHINAVGGQGDSAELLKTFLKENNNFYMKMFFVVTITSQYSPIVYFTNTLALISFVKKLNKPSRV